MTEGRPLSHTGTHRSLSTSVSGHSGYMPFLACAGACLDDGDLADDDLYVATWCLAGMASHMDQNTNACHGSSCTGDQEALLDPLEVDQCNLHSLLCRYNAGKLRDSMQEFETQLRQSMVSRASE